MGVLYSTLTDKAIAKLISQKYDNCAKGTSTEPKVRMSLEKMVKIFRKGDGKCYYSGEEFRDTTDITFERLDPLLDYEEGNVVLVRKDYNNAKSHIDRFLRIVMVPDHIKIMILKRCIQIIQRRMNKQLQQKAEQLVLQEAATGRERAAAAGRALRLIEQTKNMKRGRFNDINKSGTSD
ncbi:putative anti-sigma factor [Salmonella phage pSal-SNUABM-01]|nr:putative anti-sigma factor [Salmonella phage pSal-SNUABM-01]